MSQYKYKAMARDGRVRLGSIDAANESELEQRLSKIGLDLIRAEVTAQRTSGFGQRKIEKTDLINFCFHMEQLTKAGVPMLEGLKDLRDSVENPAFREIIASIVDEIEGGKTLS